MTEEEESLQHYIINCQSTFHGLSLKQVRILEYEYGVKNKKELLDNCKIQETVGLDWIYGFLKRNLKISLIEQLTKYKLNAEFIC